MSLDNKLTFYCSDTDRQNKNCLYAIEYNSINCMYLEDRKFCRRNYSNSAPKVTLNHYKMETD